MKALFMDLGVLKITVTRRKKVNAVINLPAYVEDAVVINSADGSRKNADSAKILIGIYRDANAIYVNRLVVNSYTQEVEDINNLYAISTKKEGAVSNDTFPIKGITSSSKIKVADLLRFVKDYKYNPLKMVGRST